MKTGFVNGFPKIPTLKYYKYHGQIYLCSIQPDPGPFKTYDTKEIPVEFKTMLFHASYKLNMEHSGFGYDNVHDNPYGDFYGPYIGQYYEDFGGGYLYYCIYRLAISWDTINLPNDCLIFEVKIKTEIVNKWSSIPFNIMVSNGMPLYPHIPGVETDFYCGNYNGDGGSAPIHEPGTFVIWFNDLGRTWINREGYTKLYLVSDQDYYRILPTANDTVGFPDDPDYWELEVTYLEAP